VEAVRDGAPLRVSLAAAATRTGFSVPALRAAYHRHRGDAGQAHGNALLTAEQDAILVGVAQAFSVNNLALSVVQIQALVKSRFSIDVSSDWVSRWVASHRRSLSLRACKALADTRAGPAVMEGTQAFCEELSLFLECHSFAPDAVFNYDETRLVQRGGNMTTMRVETAEKDRANVRSTRGNTVASLLPFVSASGAVFLSVYVHEGKFGDDGSGPVNFTLEQAPRTSRRAWPRFYCWTETGYLDGPCFRAVIHLFAAEWRTRNPGREALLFGDQLGAHRQPDTIAAALEKGVYLFSLPPNTSHINQPLDESPFGGLKRDAATGNEQEILDALVSGTSVWDTLLSAAYVAERRTLTPQSIVGAFRRCARWPFDAAAMLARVGANVGLVPPGDTVQSKARAAAAAVLLGAQQRVDATRRRSVSGQATVARGVLHAPEALLAQHRAREAARAAALVVREARVAEAAQQRVRKEVDAAWRATQRENNRCRVCCKTVRRGGGGWLGCACDVFWVCPACAKTAVASSTMAEHCQSCTDQVSVAADEGDEEEGDFRVRECYVFYLILKNSRMQF